MTSNYFSLEIGETYTKIADLKKKAGNYEITNIGSQNTTPNYYDSASKEIVGNEAKIISELIKSTKIKKKNVNIIIPDSQTFFQFMEMPKLNEKELLSAIKYQADQFIPLPLEETSIDLEIVSEDKKNKKLTILVVASPLKTIKKIRQTIETAGIIPESIENELSSTARIITEISKKDKQFPNSMIINLGKTMTSIYYFNSQESILKHAHSFKLGFQLFVKELRLNLNFDQNKAKEILKKIGFSSSSAKLETLLKPVLDEFIFQINTAVLSAQEKYHLDIKQILLINHITEITGFDKKIQEKLKLPVKAFDINNYVKINSSSQITKDLLPMFISTIAGNLR